MENLIKSEVKKTSGGGGGKSTIFTIIRLNISKSSTIVMCVCAQARIATQEFSYVIFSVNLKYNKYSLYKSKEKFSRRFSNESALSQNVFQLTLNPRRVKLYTYKL